MNDPTLLTELDFFTAQINPKQARLLVRISGVTSAAGWQITGDVYGPFCARSETLPARFLLRDAGPGESLLASSLILDPVFWTPELPATYRVRVQLTSPSGELREVTHTFGLRWFQIHGDAFFEQNKRWVLRGGVLAPRASVDSAWSQIAIVSSSPTADALATATNDGIVVLLATSERDPAQLIRELRSAAQHPAVTMAILPTDAQVTPQLSQAVPNLILAVKAAQPADIPSWAEAIVSAVDEPAFFAARWQHEKRPLIALGSGDVSSPAKIYEHCDHLRRELAPWRQCAGYLIQAES